MMDLSMFSINSYQNPGYILVFHSGIDIPSSEKPIPIVTYTDSPFAKCYTSEALIPMLQSYIHIAILYMVSGYFSKDLALCASPIPMLSGQTLPRTECSWVCYISVFQLYAESCLLHSWVIGTVPHLNKSFNTYLLRRFTCGLSAV